MATSTIEPVAHRSAMGRSLSELADGDQALLPRFPGVVYLDTAGSTKWRQIAVPDEVIGKIRVASGRPMRMTVLRALSQPMGLVPCLSSTNSDWSHTSGFSLLQYEPLPPGDYGASSTATLAEWPFEPPVISARDDEPATALHPAVQEFAQGVDDVRPTPAVIEMATRLVQAALDHTVGPEITVDDEDGMDFHLRLTDNLLVMANLFHDGTIDASVYDDSQGIPVKTVKRMRRATTSEQDLIHLFRTGSNASTAR